MAGQYEYTPDHRPYVGATSVAGLWLNGGYSGHGIMGSRGGSRLLDRRDHRPVERPDAGASGPMGPSGNPFRPDRSLEAGRHDVL